MLSTITTSDAPTPNGHYSQAVVANGFVFVAAQLPISPDGSTEVPETIEAQTRQAIDNVAAILAAAGCSLAATVSMTVFVTDIADWPAVDRVYAERMAGHRPARAVVSSPALHLGAKIAIQAIAVAPAS